MADASGKKNSCQLFSYPYFLCDKLIVFLGNQSILYLFYETTQLTSLRFTFLMSWTFEG